MSNDNFTDIPFNSENLDRFYIRTSILNAINSNISNFKGELLDVGCGKMPYRNHLFEHSTIQRYIGLDIHGALLYDAHTKPDFTWDGKKMPFEDGSFDCAFATEVLEHCPDPEVVLKETFRVLKPNGIFFFTVPFLWNLHEVPHDEYRYTPFSLERHLSNSGFKDISISATGGWHASMAQMLGLWVRRSPIPKTTRKILSILIRPLVRYLASKDKPENIVFKEGQMITGLYGTAIKKNG